jgi:hypothetical protein
LKAEEALRIRVEKALEDKSAECDQLLKELGRPVAQSQHAPEVPTPGSEKTKYDSHEANCKELKRLIALSACRNWELLPAVSAGI